MFSEKPTLICIVGPTAIGKTSLSIKIASSLKTEIISADSRQFYQEMTIGTAVPSTEELQAVRHHFIHDRSIFKNYSVGDFRRDALTVIEDLFSVKDQLVMVGGSGLYIDAVLYGLDEFPDVPPGIREQLNNELIEHGIMRLQEELRNTDQEYYNEVDINNPHRLIRALELIRSTGKKFSSYRKGPESISNKETTFNTLQVGLKAPREVVYERINRRVDRMIEKGLVEEALELFPYKDLNALQTVGYREIFEHFEGKCSLEEAVCRIKMNTRRFAKRQETWFKKNKGIQWFDHETNPQEIIDFIRKRISKDF
jgi:tRNA dimethylallyltransferase